MATQFFSDGQMERLHAIDFQGGPGTGDLMDAVEILKDLNRAGGRKVPAGAPASFVPARYADYLARAGPLLADRWNEDLVAGCYPDLLRMGGSLRWRPLRPATEHRLDYQCSGGLSGQVVSDIAAQDFRSIARR